MPTPTARRAGARRLLAVAIAAAAACAGALTHAAVASADPFPDGYPAAPKTAHTTQITGSAITVSANPDKNATEYRLFASTVYSDVWWDNIVAGNHTPALRIATGAQPTLTIANLPYSNAIWYWRMEAVNGSLFSMSGISQTGLLPPMPTGLTPHSTPTGAWLAWGGPEAGGYEVQRADDAGMTTGVRTYQLTLPVRQYTPPDLAPDTDYWLRVRATNAGSYSDWTTPVKLRTTVRMQSVRVMTYNILKLASDGTSDNGRIIAPWSQRRLAQAQLIKSYAPDVLMIEEGGNFVPPAPTVWSPNVSAPRQVDSLASALGAVGMHYNIAHTEEVWGHTGFVHNFNYILWNPAVYAAVGKGGDWQIGTSKQITANAAWQELKNRQTGAEVLVVCTHLNADAGLAMDQARQQETKNLLARARAKAAALGVPVIYGGDFNTTPLFGMHPLDGPNVAMRAVNVADAHGASQYKWNDTLDTITGYRQTPNWYGNDIDYLFLPPGVAARSWGVVANLQNGSWPGVIPSDHNPVAGIVAYPY